MGAFDDLIPTSSNSDLPQESGAPISTLFAKSTASSPGGNAFDDLIPGDRARLTFYTRFDDGKQYEDGRTAAPHPETGIPRAEEGVTIAVDPDQIPYGSRVRIPSLASYSKGGDGVFVAHDTGGDVRSRRASRGALPVLDVYVDGQDRASAQARRDAVANGVGSGGMVYQVLPAQDAPARTGGMFDDLIPKQGANTTLATPPVVAPDGTPNTVVAAPDDRPAAPPPAPPNLLERVAGDVVTAGAQAGGNLFAGIPRFVQSERAQYLENQPHPQADTSPAALEARRLEIQAELADIDEQNAHGEGVQLPSAREQQLRAELKTLTPQGQQAAKQSVEAAADARTAADRLAAAQDLVRKGNEGERPSLDTRVAEGLGSTAAALVPGLGMASIAAEASNSARGAAEDKARADGLPEDAVRAAGDEASNTALEHTAAALPAYMVAGNLAGKGVKAITPETAGAIRKFLTEATAATGANVAASAAVRAAQGEPVAPTMEGFFGADLPFALSHAMGAVRADTPKAKAAAIREALKTDDATSNETAKPDMEDEQERPVSAAPERNAPETAPNVSETPVFAQGATPQERADNFLQPPDDQPAPSAVTFKPDETVPDELSAVPRAVRPDGSTVVFDPEMHTAEQFSGLKPENPDPAKGKPPVEIASDDPDLEGIAHDDEEPPPERSAADIQRDRDLESEYRAEQEREARAGIGGAGGVELLDAVRSAGGLPTDDPVFRGELKNIREASTPVAQAGRTGTFNLFRRNAPRLDELTDRLRAHGFDVETPADVLDLLNQRVTSKRPEYGFAARAEAQSGMAASEAYFRRTPPRTPEELRPVQQRWKRALQMVAPKTALRLEIIKQDALDSLWEGRGHRPLTTDGGSPHAAYLDGVVYLSERALRDNPDQVNRVNFLHEIVHHFERVLPNEDRARLREQHQAEIASGKSPLHGADGRLRPDVDPRVDEDFSEWLAERVAWENEHHFAGEIDPAAAKTAAGRLAAHVRRFVGRVWKTFRPEMPTDEVNARFREWLGRGARADESTGEAQFARRRSGKESSSGDVRPGDDPNREDAPGSLEAAAAHVGGSDAFRRRSGTDYWPTAADRHAETAALAQSAETAGKLVQRDAAVPVPTKEGGEHLVHFDPTTQRWVKETYPGSFGGAPRFDRDANGKPVIALDQASPGEYLRRLRENNALFGDDVELEGVRPSPDGTSIIVSQSDAGGVLPDESGIVKALAEHDFVPVPGVPEQRGLTPMFYRARDRKIITDATRDNFRVVDGQTVPIDVGISEAGPKLHDHLSGLIAKDAGPRFAIRQTVQGVKELKNSREQKGEIAAGKDAAETRAGIIARQASNSVRLDFPDPKDREAMPFVVEAAGIKAALQHDLLRVQNGSDAKLVKKYVPVVRHAIDNFDRLNALKGNYEAITDKQRLIERRHGINTPQVKNYVTRLLEMPEHLKDFEPVLLGAGGSGGGGSRYFVKGRDFATLAEAIEAGYGPKSTDIADLLERRVNTGQKLVQERRLWSRLRAVTAPGDALNRPIIGQMEEHTLPGGRKEMRLPLGYESITANGEPLVVHRQYAGLFKALYGDSKLRQHTAGRLLLNLTGIAKHGTLVFDTFHVGRVLSKELFGGYQTGYNKGLSLLEYSDKDLGRAVAAGDISQAQADYSRRMRPMADELTKAGLNVGRVADNLNTDAVKHFPVIGGFNQWVFGKLSRGAMLQTALTNYARNLSRFPELGRDGAARRTAKEMNEVFGNLGSQGLFQSKTMQDLARTVFLAPQWAESQIRAELRGAGQVARIPFDAARGRLRMGTVAQGMASGVVAMLAVNQVINQISRGQFTWQNKEDDRKLDAYIPGGKRGFWLDPFSIAAETLHQAHKLYARSESALDAVLGIAANKLSPGARGLTELATGRNYAGKPFLSWTDRIRASLLDAAPFPMPLNTFVEKDPRQMLGVRWSRQAGSLEKQLLQSMGLKVQNELSAEQKMFAIGKQYRSDANQAPMAGPYSELRRALADDNTEAAKDEIRWLVQNQHKKLAAIQEAVGDAKPEKYAGPNKADNAEMVKHLTPAQKEVYQQAQMEHRLNAQKFQRIMAGMRAELAQKQ